MKSINGVRIVIIFPSTHVFGMERSTLELARLLKGAGAEICLLVNELHGRAVREIKTSANTIPNCKDRTEVAVVVFFFDRVVNLVLGRRDQPVFKRLAVADPDM